MKKLLLSILVAIAAVLSSCKATVEPDHAAAIAGTYKMSSYTTSYDRNIYSYSTISLTRKSNSKVDVSIYRWSGDGYEYYYDVTVGKSGSNYTLTSKSNSGDSFTGSIVGNAIELGYNESGTIYNVKGSK